VTIRTLLVDDEPLAIQGLELRLQAFPEVEVIDRCINGREAIRAIAAFDYPNSLHQIQVLDDSTDETRELVNRIAADLRGEGVWIDVVRREIRHGYKAGGINLDTTAGVGGADPRFLSEEVDAFELGVKAQTANGDVTVNIAAFYEEFTNFQVLEFTGTAFATFNVPVAETRGIEIEGLVRPNDELTFNLGATFLEASYPDDCAGTQTSVQVVALCGNDFTNAPQIIALVGALWEKPINDSVELFLSGQVRAESDQRTSTQAIVLPGAAQIAAAGGLQQAIDVAPPIVADIQDGKAFVNLRGGLKFADGAYTIEGWVTNLTDEVVRGVTFSTTLRGSGINNSRSAFSLPPRQYGVTVRAKF